MSFSRDGYAFDVSSFSEKATRGTSYSDYVSYVAKRIGGGAVDVVAATEAAQGHYRDAYPDLTPFVQIEGELINANHVLVSATINKTKLNPTSFNTTGASTHTNQSLLTRGTYAAPGVTAPNYRGAIGVSDSGVAGVDITVPAFEFSTRRKFEYVSVDYLLAIVAMTGRVNNAAWSIFATGEALFLGAEGGEDDDNWVDITYHFAARPNQTNVTLGNITGVQKYGWDYLWVKHREEVVGDRVLQVPEAAYVEQVYPPGNFDVLGIA